MEDEDYWSSSDISQNKFSFDDVATECPSLLFGSEDTILQRVEEGQAHSARYRASSSTLSLLSNSEEPRVVAKVSGKSIFYDDTSVPSTGRQLSATEAAKFESEVRALRRALDDATKDRWTPMPPKQMIRRIIMGNPYNLGDYKSKELKLKLLEEALESHDGNAIMAVVLYLKGTLKQSLFYHELRSYPAALDHYLIYLRNRQDFVELSDLLSMADRNEEAAAVNYKLALRSRMIAKRISSLKACITNHFKGDSNGALAAEHVSLLEVQCPVEEDDVRLQNDPKRAGIFFDIPRTTPLVNASVISTLYYCCLYHYDKPENHLASPLALKQRHQLTGRQFAWTAMTARARLARFQDLDSLVTTKSWLPGNKKFVISPEKVLEVLQQHSADTNVLNRFAKMIENAEQRLEVAAKFKCHEVVVDTLVLMRDRQRLKGYEKHILPHSKEYFYWHSAVNASTTKWKN